MENENDLNDILLLQAGQLLITYDIVTTDSIKKNKHAMRCKIV